MLTWFTSAVPLSWGPFIGPFVLLIVGILIERNFVGRITLFTNTMAINLFFLGMNVPDILGWYINIGLIFGIFGLFSRISGFSMRSWMYAIAFAYCSVVVGAIMLYFTANPLPVLTIVTNVTAS